MTLRVGENRIDMIFLANGAVVFKPIIVNKGFCGQVRNVIEIGENGSGLEPCEFMPGISYLRREMSEDNVNGLIWSVEDRPDEEFTVGVFCRPCQYNRYLNTNCE
jgi:hypothetical protein